MRALDLTGQRFRKLVAIAPHGRRGKRVLWLCRCDCGNEKAIPVLTLRNGNSTSCGCQQVALGKNLRHGMSKTSEHKIWTGIHERCTNPNSKFFSHYGGRGIRRCERWDAFENFYVDMGPRPSRLHTIERIDNNGNYQPGNCRWALAMEQQGNTRKNVCFTIGGETAHLSEWARRFDIDPDLVSQRILRDGMDPEIALTKPKRLVSKPG
jgi:hypothetical protein